MKIFRIFLRYTLKNLLYKFESVTRYIIIWQQRFVNMFVIFKYLEDIITFNELYSIYNSSMSNDKLLIISFSK